MDVDLTSTESGKPERKGGKRDGIDLMYTHFLGRKSKLDGCHVIAGSFESQYDSISWLEWR